MARRRGPSQSRLTAVPRGGPTWIAVNRLWRTSTMSRRRGNRRIRALLRRHPAVDADHGAGHEAGLVARQEQGDVGDLARLTRPADRLEGVDRVVDLLEPAEHFGVRVVDRR